MRKNACLVAVSLALLLLAACSPFGARKTDLPAVAEAATATPVPPTEVPDLITPTWTVVPATPTPTITPTSAPEDTATPEPTPTPTTEAEALPEEPAEAESASTSDQPALKVGNVVRNGSFEEGFDAKGVAQEWTTFSSDKGAVFGWEPDSDPMHVSHGSHAQVMRIMGPGDPNTFVGIYQTIDVVPGETYTVAMHGVIRSSLAAENYKPLAFRFQYAIDETGGSDWKAVDWADWTDPGWNDVQLDVKWPPMDAYVIEFTPTTDKITLFLRGWSKWAFFQSEAKFYVDGIFFHGPMPAEGMPPTGGTMIWVPLVGLLAVVGLAIWELCKRKAPGGEG